MNNYQIAAVFGIIIFLIFIFSRNKKSAQKEINNLNELDYKSTSSIKFGDIAGNFEAKESLQEIADFIKNPEKYEKFNARMPRGVLLYGSPGTGKTLMAKALAGEAGVPFYAVSGSDFVQVYAGLGAGRIRTLFKKAKKSGKSVIFIDEIDAIGKKRMGGNMRGSDEGDRTLNALLTEMSGFDDSTGIVIVAATNRIDTLDSALLRPGRFDRQIEIMLPDKNARKDILALYLGKRQCSENIDLDSLADLTVYFSGAEIENLVNEASLIAIRENSDKISSEQIEKAYLNLVAGVEKKNVEENRKQKTVTSYHEAGHAFISKYLMPENKISRVSVIPTSKGAGGYTLSTPDGTEVITKAKIKNRISVLLAGRVAEEIFFGRDNITVGAQNDIEKSTSLAVDYVAKYGMDEDTGFVNITVLSEKLNISISGAEKSVKRLIDELYAEVMHIIENNRETVKNIAEKLADKEVLYDNDFKNM
jgi:cell division protease FtsH